MAFLAIGFAPFVLCEGILRAVGYHAPGNPYEAGFDPKLKVFERDGDQVVVAPGNRRTWHTQAFALARKPANLRIFAVGDSVTWGHRGNEFATPLRAYPELLQDLLRQQRPGRGDEVLNCGARTFASERATRVGQEVLQFSPDAVLANLGTSEHLEADLRADLARQTQRMPSWLASLRIVEVLEGWLRSRGTGLSLQQSRERDASLRAPFVTQASLLTGEVERAQLVQTAKARLEALARACQAKNVRLVLATVPSNLRFPPFATHFAGPGAQAAGEALIASTGALIQAGNARKAEKLLSTALVAHPEAAGLHYRLAQALEKLGDLQRARLSYLEARDTDACPARAIGAFNDMVRQLARDMPSVTLVDMEGLFEAEVPDGIPDDRLFLDNSHPRPAMHLQMAQALLQTLTQTGVVH